MSSGITADRVYQALKTMIKDRSFRPGERLDPARLATELVSSVTPVRDALNRLIGERLVETQTGDGFHLPQIDAPALQDLYDWSIEVLAMAMRSWPDEPPPNQLRSLAPPAAAAEAIFVEIAQFSRNVEHVRAIVALNDRLHPARLCEQGLFHDGASEVVEIDAALTAGNRDRLRILLTAYHRRRRRAAPEIARALYRAPTNSE